jgi:RNA polymerase sigma factor (sigma-70 family)
MAAFYACDGTAFDEITRRWQVRLYAYFTRRHRSPEAAEDLVQETLIRVFTTKEPDRPRYDPERPFAPYIYQIAFNCNVDAGRQSQRRPPPSPLPENLETTAPPVEEAVLFRLALYECLRGLTEEERYFFEQWEHGLGTKSQTEIARELGVVNSRVTAIKENARGKLQECLKRKGFA